MPIMNPRRFILRTLIAAAMCGTGAPPVAAEIAVPSEWLRAAPGPREAALLEQGAGRHGWRAMAGALRTASTGAYLRGDLGNAQAWAMATRWAEIWGSTEGEEHERWRAAMEAEGWPGMRAEAVSKPDPARPLAERLPAELRMRLLADPTWSAEYFALEKSVDRRGEVLGILARLHQGDAAGLAEFSRLAMAVALVHDTPPPPEWPHGQVTAEALPRRLAPAEDVFRHLAGISREGKALWRADKLETAELRFAVDLALPAEEREWALGKIKAPLANLAEVYSSIHYRRDRVEDGVYVWPGARYRLEDILREGGICVDQAYFATQAGKARGVPTILFCGAGRDGRHAWFGHLGQGRKWFMDGGRHESQNYVTGVALDPQTWTEVSDHELKFLSEGFRRERNAREARTHADFARWLLEDGKGREAETAARAAVRLERRTLDAWDLLLERRPAPGAEREAVAKEAAGGFSAYPDLQARYLGIAVESLRARGEVAEADRMGRELARRFAEKRGDLSTREISAQLARAMTSASVEEQVRLYRSLLRQFGRGAGTAMWDEVVRPFVAHLAASGRWKEAKAALKIARESLGVVHGSQMEAEMRELDAKLSELARVAGAAK
jgi:hypothetical protein